MTKPEPAGCWAFVAIVNVILLVLILIGVYLVLTNGL